MMTVSDIFDALTASDRPYKRAVPALKALDIIRAEVKEAKLDPDIVQVFIDAKIWQKLEEPVTPPKDKQKETPKPAPTDPVKA
jgi:HD-GYP domain-containing protein (c-di-GMP phosphodiesterase class II)